MANKTLCMDPCNWENIVEKFDNIYLQTQMLLTKIVPLLFSKINDDLMEDSFY